MTFFNIYGLVVMVVIMIPNIIYAIKHKENFENISKWKNDKFKKATEILEQIGRYGCFTFMIFNFPGTYFGWIFQKAFLIYLSVNIILIFIYCLIWIICFNSNTIFKSLSLSIIPSIIFLFSGILLQSVLLILSAIIFAPTHILISYKNSDKEK